MADVLGQFRMRRTPQSQLIRRAEIQISEFTSGRHRTILHRRVSVDNCLLHESCRKIAEAIRPTRQDCRHFYARPRTVAKSEQRCRLSANIF